MDIPSSYRRKLITDFFMKDDWDGLQKLGLVLKEGPGQLTCDGYVIKKLGYVSSSDTLYVVQNAVRLSDPPSGQSIILYRFKDRRLVQHYGIFDRGKVVSKWEHGPVFEHGFADVPEHYGNWAEFIEVTAEFRHRLQQAQFGRTMGPEYY